MAYTIKITRASDGKTRERTYDFERNDFWWIDGNMSCDCNRHWEFQRAGGVAEKDLTDMDCGEGAYSVELPDGTRC